MDTASTDIYTLSLHDALPIFPCRGPCWSARRPGSPWPRSASGLSRQPSRQSAPEAGRSASGRSEEHTSELQSRFDLVCRLLLEKKNENKDRVSGDNVNMVREH